MVNFGGDIRAIGSKPDDDPWRVGIESPESAARSLGEIALRDGGVATSGDAKRFCRVSGVRLGHILNPRTGWPVREAPQSVTVLAGFCLEAGLLSTLAMLHGPDAETFLSAQDVIHHCVR
jgi:thiamine biosynthesis lipoprotein